MSDQVTSGSRGSVVAEYCHVVDMNPHEVAFSLAVQGCSVSRWDSSWDRVTILPQSSAAHGTGIGHCSAELLATYLFTFSILVLQWFQSSKIVNDFN